MPPILDKIDILEYPAPASPGNKRPEPCRRERARFLEWLVGLFTPVPRLRPCRQEYGVPGAPRFETPLDLLARDHPDRYLLVMAGSG